ncbi:MAG: exodeoxyribonuclease V subunit alpha [Lonepinella koalarum]|nr:exodeoxyribonuclease V subunit alpha [Lonepinella koalarum]
MLNLLYALKQKKVISQTTYYFAKFISDKQQGLNYSKPVENLAVLLVALCNHAHQQGHSCIFLNRFLEKCLFNLSFKGQEGQMLLAEIHKKIDFLPASQWQEALRYHIAFTFEPTKENKPFVFQYNSLYLYRVWQDEFRVANFIQQSICQSEKSAVEKTDIWAYKMADLLNQYFEPNVENKINWQKIAVATALRQQFCLISGGPGTGKTYTVARLLIALQEMQMQNKAPFLQIKLAAPTGKAAARLTESIENTFNQLESQIAEKSLTDQQKFAQLRHSINTESQTLHRLLGVRQFSEETQFNPQNPLPIDLLVIDEASMVDLSMMAKLVQALKKKTKLILIGDKDQLSSVEAGAILGELGQFSEQNYSEELTRYLAQTTGQQLPSHTQGDPVRDYICYLRESRRFDGNSGIGILAEDINNAQGEESWQRLKSESFTDLTVYENTDPQITLKQVMRCAIEQYQDYLILATSDSPLNKDKLTLIFEAFKKQRFLTALRVGLLGVDNLNKEIANTLKNKGLISFRQAREWYNGKPIMITENDSHVNLYNGDIGLYLVDEKGEGRVWFELKAGKIVQGKVQSTGEFRAVLPSRLPKSETAFAMTVHKSQGSEFSHTFFVLPSEKSAILSKELIYTAVTRAKVKLTIFGHKLVWISAVKTPTKRYSGLKNLLSIKNFT